MMQPIARWLTAGYGLAATTPAISRDLRRTARLCWIPRGNDFVALTNAATRRDLGIYTALRFVP
jgi:hypothetical protein